MRIEKYVDKGNQFRWRARADNGRIIADSGESYTRKTDCARAIKTFVREITEHLAAALLATVHERGQ